ncbi:peptidylprolyl isomerase [Parabacteroides sp. PF5-9]|uniref:peptidylprolyl isomerase n=1 Tax=Parabacteroides sp. PF5-9 TaxID=1742404 RepID=UPI00247546E7|nr:peptidylprolyl isomerase [Parabacteroides sp. PF5-9]MDH6357852.1 cyclophilin family peptidyl-prolyl cis-trans isomerase [Parabacteroides sp. PF5-9]
MKLHCFAVLIGLFFIAGCSEKTLDPDKPVYVTVKTTMGDVTVLLYDDTPLHKENFIRLCQSDFYKDVIFHRVIKEFVVQGGDPESKKQEAEAVYGHGDGGYTVPAEILPHYFNKRGALIDAKLADAVNTERASAGTQFCFVQGKILNDTELSEKEIRINEIRKNWLYHKFRAELKEKDPGLAQEEKEDELHAEATLMVIDTLDVLGAYVIPSDRREVYKTIGGIPHLDGSVTIFGEVIEGFDIVEKISLVETNQSDRPVKDVIILSTKVFQR